MNRIFKVIWSEARNAYVVVSELTKRQSKSCSTKKLLAVLIAAGVFSMAGMHAPVSAATIEEATRDNYIAIEATHFGNDDPLYHGDKKVGDSVSIGEYQYTLTKIQISGEQYALYWVRNGYGLKVETDAKYFEGAATGLKVSPYKLNDSVSTEGLVIRGLSGISDTDIKTAVNKDSLHLLSYDNYAGVSNSGGIVTKSSYNYLILRDNTWVDVGQGHNPDGQAFTDNFKEVTYNSTTGYYEFNGKQVAFENVYSIDNKLGVFLTSTNGTEVYTGPVYGLNNEILITAYDENSKTWSTVWGSEMSDPYSTIGSMTVGQFNNILADIHNEDAILADADVVKTVVNGTSSAINLQNKKGNLIPGITVTRTAIDGSDTVVTIAEEENINNKIDLVTGSRVSAEASNGNLTKLTINGVDYALSGVDTNTTYTISSNNGTGNVVKKYTITGSDSSTMEFVDTDTRVTSGSISYSAQEKGEDGVPTSGIKGTLTLGVNDGSSITITGLNDTTLKSGGFDIDASGEEGESETSRKMFYIEDTAGNRIEIENVANIEDVNVVRDKVEQGFNVSAGSKTHNIKLGETLNFVNGTNTEVSLDDSGAIKIDATDTNTYTTEASYNASTKKATFSGINGLSYDLDLSEITSGLGSMSSWTAKVGETIKAIGDGNTLEFVGDGNANVTMNEAGVITISAIDTNTKYQITEKTNGESTPANVVKTYNFKEIGSSEAGVDLVDTDTTYSVEDVTDTTSGAVSAKKLVNNLGQEIDTFVDTDTDTKYTAGTGISIDPSDNNRISINASEVANSVSINYKANGGSAKSVSLSQGLNFVQGDNVQISTGENGVVNISATDTNTYTTSANYDASTKKATFSGTNGLSYDLNLSSITSGLGSMSSWTAKVGETTKSISNNDVLEFAGANSASISMENGVITISAIDTNTKYQITEKTNGESTPANVVKTYNFSEIGSSGVGVDLIDTDTTYRVEDVTSSTPGAISAKKLVNNLGQEIDTFVDTDTTYTAGTGISIDQSNNNKISIIPSEVANNVSISYKANSGNAKSVSLSDGLNFVQGGSVQITTGENGVVNISATDTNTYTTSASYDTSTKKATFSGTNGLSYDLDLSEITSGLGSMSSWIAKVGGTIKAIGDGNTLEFVGGSNANVTMNENGVITISAIDTNTKYRITEKIKDSSTPANVVKTYNFNEIDSSGVGVDLIDTDTTYRVEDVTSSTPGAISAKKLVNNLGQEIDTFVDTDTDTKYTAGTGISIDPSDNNRISIDAGEVANSVNINYKANGGSAKSVSLSDGLNFVQGGSVQITTDENGVVNISGTDTRNTTIAGKNIDVTYDADNLQYTVKTVDDVVFTSVTANTATIGGIGISSTGITMNGQKITGLAAGEADTDAVNFSQLKEYAATAGANTKVLAGKNISVESNTDGGKNEYTVNLDNNVTLGSDIENGSLLVKSSVGDVLISNGQIIGDKYALTNDGGAVFANGVISAAGDGTFRAANGSFTVFADGTVDSKMGEDGRFLATSQGLSVAKGSNAFVVTGDGISLSAGESALVVGAGGTAIKGGLNVLGSKITNVAAGVADTDAVNVGQLREAVAAGDTNTHIESATKAVANDNTVAFDIVDEKTQTKVGEVKITDIAKASDLGDVSKLDADLKNSESNVTTVVDAVNNLNDKVGDLQYLNVDKGAIENGDDTTTAIGKLNQALQNVSLEATAHNTVSNAAGDTNITISESTNSDGGTNYALALNKEKIDLGNVIIEGEKGSITAKNVTAGKTSIGDAGVQFDGKTYIDEQGLNANNQKITNVAAGEVSETSKDAVNGSQLYATNQQINQNIANINNLDNKISRLGSRVNKVGAGAAALAALHPLDFDPDDKLSFAVGMGNYAGQNAAAIGAFYRPNEKVMMSVGGTYGNDENMVNVGLSFALDRTNNVSNSRTAMAREIIELRSHVAKQDQQIAQLTALVNKLVGNDAVKGEGVLFPDVPENHWAYEYINGLVRAGVIDGYPDGTFGGERSVTRYEFASMLYKAMLKGTILNRDIMKEFESEIARIRVDRISGKDNDANKIERVRVNYQNRDNYGTRIAK